MAAAGSKALWDFIALSGGEVLGKLAGLVAFAYLARVLGPEVYGAVEVAGALLVFFALIIDFGYGPVGAREITHHPQLVAQYAGMIPAARVLLTVLSIPAMCITAMLMKLPPDSVTLVFLYAFAMLAAPWNQRWLFQGLDRMTLVSLGQLVRMLALTAGVIVLVRTPGDLMRVGYVEITASAAMAAYFIAMQLRLSIPVRLHFELRPMLDISRQSISLGLSQAVWALNQYLPTLLIASLSLATEVSWFGAAHRIVFSIVSFSMIYHFNLFPSVTQRLRQSQEAFSQLVIPSFRVTAWGGFFIAIVITFLAGPICELVYGSDYAAAALPMAIIIWSLPLTLFSGHSRWPLVAVHKQRYVLYAQLAGLAATAVSGAVLIPRYGSVGGAVAMLLNAACVWFTAHYFAARFVGNIPFLGFIVRQLLLAALVMTAVFGFAGLTWYSAMLGIAGFALLAFVVDRELPGDIRRLMQIKNERPVAGADAGAGV
jgi:PST family polysaccharide transporter